MIVLSIIMLLTVIALTGLGAVRDSANNAACRNNLRQLAEATGCYLNENARTYFPYQQNVSGGVQWYFGFEANTGSKKEGERLIDLTRAPLHQYGISGDIVNCPELTAMFRGPGFKPKFVTQSTSYGYNILLSGKRAVEVKIPGETILFADCAQINTFQSPASPNHPLLEEFYIVGPGYKTIHFRHNGRANVVFCDGHIASFTPVNGKKDTRMKGVMVGEVDAKLFFLESAKK